MVYKVILALGVQHSVNIFMPYCMDTKMSGDYLLPYQVITLPTIFFMLFIKSLWLIYFISESLYLLFPSPFSRIPHPFSSGDQFVVYICVSASVLFVNLFCVLLDSICKWNYVAFVHMSFSVSLISLSIIPSRAIHIVNGKISFFLIAE